MTNSSPVDAADAPAAGIDDTARRWLVDHAGLVEPLRTSLIAGGYSNLTYLVEDATGTRRVFRRPPLGHVLATAHDVAREGRIMAALADSPVPVPPVLGIGTDGSDTAYVVTDFVEGDIVYTHESAAALEPVQRRRLCTNVLDVLVDIHRVDLDAVGLGELRRPGNFVERQLRRWQRQMESSRTRELPLVTEVYERLSAAVPEQREAALLHGDFRIDNNLVGPDQSVRATLDWELAATGDYRADLGLVVAYWGEPDDDLGLPPTPTQVPGFLTRREVVEHYATASGRRDLDELGFFVAFSHWKIACIAEGVYARYLAGVMGEVDVDMDRLRRHPEARAEAAWKALEGEL